MNSHAPLEPSHAVKRELAGESLSSSGTLRLRVSGWSMLPTIWPGDTLIIEPIKSGDVSEGDIVLFSRGHRFVAHRVVATPNQRGNANLQTQGDAVPCPDSPVSGSELMGKVSSIVRNGKCIEPDKSLRLPERAVASLFRRSAIVARVVVGVHGMRHTAPDQT
jgi:signal peptidase I